MAVFTGFPMGLETEGWVHQPQENHTPFDLFVHLKEINEAAEKYTNGRVEVDAGLGHLELVTGEPGSPAEAVESLKALRSCLPRGVCVFFSKDAPWNHLDGANLWNPKQRYDAIREGAALESKMPHLINIMTKRASMHINIDLDPTTPEGLTAFNVLHHGAPHIADYLAEKYGLVADGLFGMWSYWADSRRFPQLGRWFATSDCLTTHLADIPALIREVNPESDVWGVDLKSPSGFHNPASLGTLWWQVRVKVNPVTGKKYIELRFTPPMSPEDPRTLLLVTEVGDSIYGLADMGGKHGVPETAEAAKPIFTKIGERFTWFPREPLDCSAWSRSASMRLPDSFLNAQQAA